MKLPNLAIKVIDANSTYTARILKSGGYKSSCTAGADQAALAVARRWYGDKAAVRPLTDPDERRELAAAWPAYAKVILTEATYVMEVR